MECLNKMLLDVNGLWYKITQMYIPVCENFTLFNKKNLLLFFFKFARKPHAVNMLQREGGIWECRELAGDCKAGVGELGLGQGQQHLFPPPSHFGQPGIVLVIHKCKHTKYAHI